MKKVLLLCIMSLMALSLSAQEYVDLGLPSGTKWKTVNETKPNDSVDLYTYEEALELFGNQLPTKEQLEELKDKCVWKWNEDKKGCTVVGPNGKTIFLPVACHRYCAGVVNSDCSYGRLWSSTPENSNMNWYKVTGNTGGYAWKLDFDLEETSTGPVPKCLGLSVRLVKNVNIGIGAKNKE